MDVSCGYVSQVVVVMPDSEEEHHVLCCAVAKLSNGSAMTYTLLADGSYLDMINIGCCTLGSTVEWTMEENEEPPKHEVHAKSVWEGGGTGGCGEVNFR